MGYVLRFWYFLEISFIWGSKRNLTFYDDIDIALIFLHEIKVSVVSQNVLVI